MFVVWVKSISPGLIGQRDEKGATADYENSQWAYNMEVNKRRSQERAHDLAEQDRLAKLAEASQWSERDNQLADALEAIARQSRLAAADLTDITMTRKLQEIVREAGGL